MKHSIILAALLLVPATAWAQGVTPGGVIFGDGRDFSQDLTRPTEPGARPTTAPTTQRQRADQQRRANQNFPGTGRPVAAPPPTTPQPGAMRSAIAPPTRPIAPERPQAARPLSPRPEAAAIATPEPRVVPPAPASATPPPSTRAAPVMLQPGQSTGAARGTPASR